MGSRKSILLTVAIALATVLGVPSAAQADRSQLVKVPQGWRISVQRPIRGVEVIRMARGNQRVSVVAVRKNAPIRIEHVLARNQLAGRGARTARTTSICRRNDCIAGINGAFFDPGSGLPFGGITSEGELIRSMTSSRPHVAIERGLEFNVTTPGVQLVAYEPDVFNGGSGFEEREHRFALRGVNRSKGPDGIVAYTRRWAGRTPGSTGRELVLRAVNDPTVAVGSKRSFRVVATRPAGGPIPQDGIVLSGNGVGSKQLADLWRRIADGSLLWTVSLDVAPGPETMVATRPLILRNSKVIKDNSTFGQGRHPRSVLASRPDGTVLFVVIDGRAKNRRGMSLRGAARFVEALGASDAANLDGGGSATLTLQGRLHSQPSGNERSVATALLIVRR